MRGNRQAFAFVFAFATVLVLFGTLPAGWGFTQPTRATCPSQLLSGRRSPWDPSIAPWVVPGGGRGGRAGVLPPLGSSADPGAAGGSGARGESSPAERRIHRRIYRRLRRVSSGVRRSVPLFLLAAAMLLPTNRAAVAAGGRSGFSGHSFLLEAVECSPADKEEQALFITDEDDNQYDIEVTDEDDWALELTRDDYGMAFHMVSEVVVEDLRDETKGGSVYSR